MKPGVPKSFLLMIFHLTLLMTFSSFPPEPAYGQEAVSSPFVREFEVPLPASGPLGIAASPDGVIWFTMEGANKIGSFDTDTETFSLFEVPWQPSNEVRQFGLEGILFDSMGMVWFTHSSTNRIGRYDPGTNSFEGFELPTPNAVPFWLLQDVDGNIWFTELRGDKIGVIDIGRGITEYPLAEEFSGPAGLTFDSDGKLWFTEAFGGRIGVLDPSNGSITEFDPPPDFILFSPVGIVVDDDGVVWFADHGGSEIVRFDPKTDEWRKFSTSEAPPEIYPVSLPNDLEMDSNGDLWVAEHAGNKISRFNRNTGILTGYVIPTFRAISLWLTIDSEGNIWFAEAEGNRIGVLDPSQRVPFSVSLSPTSVVLDPDTPTVLTLSIDTEQDLSDPLELAAYGVPKTIEFDFDPESIAPRQAGSTTVEIIVNPPDELEDGIYFFSISAGSQAVIQTVTVRLVNPPDDSNNLLIFLSIATTAGLTVIIMTFVRRFRKRLPNRRTRLS